MIGDEGLCPPKLGMIKVPRVVRKVEVARQTPKGDGTLLVDGDEVLLLVFSEFIFLEAEFRRFEAFWFWLWCWTEVRKVWRIAAAKNMFFNSQKRAEKLLNKYTFDNIRKQNDSFAMECASDQS